mmetsp:Transcript_94328/g.270170  ORF Transcript_94328/g.270170 Transcript_94328/m.270170 type:complete len:140 (+) Transcript_94328:871-1290(+)
MHVQIELVGSMFHHSSQRTHHGSVVYKNHVDAFFKSRGYNVTHRWNHTPDEDLVYMGHARTFVYSGGGFSQVVGECVHRLGGTTPIALEESLASGRTGGTVGARTSVVSKNGHLNPQSNVIHPDPRRNLLMTKLDHQVA